jgi:hypothetical protein
MRSEVFIVGILAVIAILYLMGRGKGPELTPNDMTWSYVKSPSGKCYEMGTYYRLGGYSYTVGGPVESSYCK